MAIIIVVLISVFFLLGFFSIYVRQCGGANDSMDALTAAAVAVGGRSRMPRGLDSAVLETFPTLVYSEVKEHKIGKGALECAICLNEFEDDETIRLLPKCDHVFHQECIDAWLATHVTCPVCRTNYAKESANPPVGIDAANIAHAPSEAAAATPVEDHVNVSVDEELERKEEIRELARIASRVRGNGSRRPKRLPRSHSTGHSMVHEAHDRYTLRLPDNVRKEIIAAGMMQRAKSFAVTGSVGGCSRKISRGIGEASSRRGRTIQLGRSDRWPSFFLRSLSAKIPAWGPSRKGEEGTTVKGGSSKSGKDWFGSREGSGGSGSQGNPNSEPAESSIAAMNRV
ncbi:hypothetical protein HPP92_005650 [Vanilla planifolia]|uniref:RING-type E3 ubiquitin transferase n=1 Tax=Vanilla planifolia TaxID=51239 RepID=A0A835RU17_VANPL|nr:hypothetical protein HPP92_005650 [Vanilla planifolia]